MEAAQSIEVLCPGWEQGGRPPVVARKLFEAMQGPESNIDLPRHQGAFGEPPHTVSVFSDGSVIDSTAGDRALAGAGVWFPSSIPIDENQVQGEHTVQQVHMHESFKPFFHEGITHGALCVWTPLTGARPSSTRAEIVGLIMAMLASGPVHVGTDSLAAAKRLWPILAGKAPRRPWGLMNNGDLWQVAQNLAEQRGLSTTRLTKVKGHAEEEHILNDVTTRWKKRGNDIADTVAQWGREARPNHAVLRQFIATQIARLTALVVCTQGMMLDILKARTKLREGIMKYLQQAPRLVAHVVVPKCQQDEPFDILRSQSLLVRQKAAPKDFVDRVMHFVCAQSWFKAEVPRISWLELLIAFDRKYGEPRGTQHINALAADFRKRFIRALQGTVRPDQVALFEGGTCLVRFQSIGFCTPVKGLCIYPDWPKENWGALARCVLALREGVEAEQLRLFDRGCLSLPAVPLSLRKVAPWRAITPEQAEIPPDAPSLKAYPVQCQLCGFAFTFTERPCPQRGAWPKWHCKGCGKWPRAGDSICRACNFAVRKCACRTAPLSKPVEQRTVLSFFRRAA